MGSLASLLGWQRRGRARALVALAGASLLLSFLLFPPAKAFAASVFLLGLIGASAVDLDRMIIPDLFTAGLALAGVALSVLVPSLHLPGQFVPVNCLRSGAAALLGLAAGSSLALWFGLFGEIVLGREVLGFGDVKFLGAIGAFCGWQGAVFSFFGGGVLGAIALAAGEIHRRLTRQEGIRLLRVDGAGGESAALHWRAQFPFGPMLAAAAALYLLGLHSWVDGWLAPYLALF